MKNNLITLAFIMGTAMFFSSCATLFTPTRQTVYFTGENGIAIYDKTKKLGEIKEGTATVKIKKKMSSKTLFAKKDGYDNTPIRVESVFNPISLLNLLIWPGFIVDIATGKICKYDEDIIEIEMKKKND